MSYSYRVDVLKPVAVLTAAALALGACAPVTMPLREGPVQAPTTLNADISKLNLPQETSQIWEIEEARAKIGEILGLGHKVEYMDAGNRHWLVIDSNIWLMRGTQGQLFARDESGKETARLANELQQLVKSKENHVTVYDIYRIVNGEEAHRELVNWEARPEYKNIGLLVGRLRVDDKEPYKDFDKYTDQLLCPVAETNLLGGTAPVLLYIGK